VWSNLVDFSNTAEALTTLFHSPQVLTRENPAIAEPMTALRQATARRTRDEPDVEAVTPGATGVAKALLARLYGAVSAGTLSGQENSPQAVAAATLAMADVTGKTPAIYGAELGITSESAFDPKIARHAIVEEAKSEYARGAAISLSWHAMRPTDDPPRSYAKSVQGALTDFEWNELLTAGTDLNKRWCAQVDDVAETLRGLQDAGIPVLWQPYPEPNGKTYWWAGRKGSRGSAELYRELYRRLVDHDRLHNLVWVWQTAAPGFGPNSPGSPDDYFPGLLYVDAVAMSVQATGNGRFRADESLARLSVAKPIGIELTGAIPASDFFSLQRDWAWFLASPAAPASQAPALTALYGDARVVSLKTMH
jgi:mannan endo-1,4-beta-mannosidase